MQEVTESLAGAQRFRGDAAVVSFIRSGSYFFTLKEEERTLFSSKDDDIFQLY